MSVHTVSAAVSTDMNIHIGKVETIPYSTFSYLSYCPFTNLLFSEDGVEFCLCTLYLQQGAFEDHTASIMAEVHIHSEL